MEFCENIVTKKVIATLYFFDLLKNNAVKFALVLVHLNCVLCLVRCLSQAKFCDIGFQDESGLRVCRSGPMLQNKFLCLGN
jgi:hypothetical protein